MTLDALDLYSLRVGAVVLAHDWRAGDWNAWQKYDDVHELRDESGDYAPDAWSSPAYKSEHSNQQLADMAQGRVVVLWDGVTPPA
jgi:hypothetical protein